MSLVEQLDGLNAWSLDTDHPCIQKTWRFERFDQAISFFNQVAALAQAHDHHPEVRTCYVKVTLRLWTHEVAGLTEKDFALARAIDQIDMPR